MSVAKSSNRPRGFTLVEIAVVVTILALGTTIVVAYLDGLLPQSKLQAAARSLAAQIADIRSTSITQGLPYQIEYDLDHDRYRIVTPFRAGGGVALQTDEKLAQDWNYFPEGVRLKTITIGGGDSIGSGLIRIEFDPLGSSIEHDVDIQRENPEADFTLHVDGLTGLVRFVAGKSNQVKLSDTDFP